MPAYLMKKTPRENRRGAFSSAASALCLQESKAKSKSFGQERALPVQPQLQKAHHQQAPGSISGASILKRHFPFWAQMDTEYSDLLGYPGHRVHYRAGIFFFMVKEFYLLFWKKIPQLVLAR